ncbi:glycoside hydrolase family 6 protein [Jatrophihabitans sp. YIM 134969]
MSPAVRRRIPAWAVAALVAGSLLVSLQVSAPSPAGATPAATAPAIDLGSGFVTLPSEATRWVAAHPDDSRTPRIRSRITSRPAALWLTGPESYPNLTDAVRRARAADGTLVLTLYDIPGRNDGIAPPSTVTPAQYRTFVDRVVAILGTTRAAVVVEPDALWFVDRQTPPGTKAYTQRMASLRYVVDTFTARAPGSRLYLDAGTSSGSVTPARMAALLDAAGVAKVGGFAVNVSSFAPNGEIEPYAAAVRSALRTRFGLTDPRFVVDTSRNGNATWDGTWCNPAGRRLGVPPALYVDATGLDATLWVKQPGTSDGDCGNGPGSYGGQFLPAVAYQQAR